MAAAHQRTTRRWTDRSRHDRVGGGAGVTGAKCRVVTLAIAPNAEGPSESLSVEMRWREAEPLPLEHVQPHEFRAWIVPPRAAPIPFIWTGKVRCKRGVTPPYEALPLRWTPRNHSTRRYVCRAAGRPAGSRLPRADAAGERAGRRSSARDRRARGAGLRRRVAIARSSGAREGVRRPAVHFASSRCILCRCTHVAALRAGSRALDGAKSGTRPRRCPNFLERPGRPGQIVRYRHECVVPRRSPRPLEGIRFHAHADQRSPRGVYRVNWSVV